MSGADPMVLSFGLSLAPRVAVVDDRFRGGPPAGRDGKQALQSMAEAVRSKGVARPARARLPEIRSSLRADEVLPPIRSTTTPHALRVRAGAPKDYLSRRLEILDGVGTMQSIARGILSGSARLAARHDLRPRPPSRDRGLGPPATSGAAPGAVPSATHGETLASGLLARVEQNLDSNVFAVHVLLRPRSASEPPGRRGSPTT